MQLTPEIKKILLIFLSWRIYLIGVTILAVVVLPLAQTDKFLGGTPKYHFQHPNLFSWANFDGEHYLAISMFGYKSLEQAFFPFYPALIHSLSVYFYNPPDQKIMDEQAGFLWSTIAGLIISNVAFLISLIFLWRLIKIDYSKEVAYLTLFILMLFPTSFFFGALYTESLFLLLLVMSFYSARKSRWFWAGFFGLLAALSRAVGILILPALFLEIYQQKVSLKKVIPLLLIPAGTIAYMYYQWLSVGDPLAFYNLQTIVGQQHQAGIITWPQIIFRYIKILLTLNPASPLYQTTVLEFLTGILFFILPIYGYFKKVRWSYLFFAMTAFLAPTIQGSFSSLPRYITVLFGSFLVLALGISRFPKVVKLGLAVLSLALLTVESALFLRGYWVS